MEIEGEGESAKVRGMFYLFHVWPTQCECGMVRFTRERIFALLSFIVVTPNAVATGYSPIVFFVIACHYCFQVWRTWARLKIKWRSCGVSALLGGNSSDSCPTLPTILFSASFLPYLPLRFCVCIHFWPAWGKHRQRSLQELRKKELDWTQGSKTAL